MDNKIIEVRSPPCRTLTPLTQIEMDLEVSMFSLKLCRDPLSMISGWGSFISSRCASN